MVVYFYGVFVFGYFFDGYGGVFGEDWFVFFLGDVYFVFLLFVLGLVVFVVW